MPVETAVSVAMLTGFIWAAQVLVPRALRAGDPIAIASAVLTAVLALLMWLLVGVGVRSGS